MLRFMKIFISFLLMGGVLTLALTGSALAHHPIGAQVPDTAWNGLLSGIGHPLIGLDHLAFLVAISLLAALYSSTRRIGILSTFVVATLAGTSMHIVGVALPMADLAIALSVVAVGAMLLTAARYRFPLVLAFGVLAGTLHGFGYAASVIGVEPTPLLSYLAGVALIQLSLGLGIATLFAALLRWLPSKGDSLVQLAGVGVTALGTASVGFVLIIGASIQLLPG